MAGNFYEDWMNSYTPEPADKPPATGAIEPAPAPETQVHAPTGQRTGVADFVDRQRRQAATRANMALGMQDAETATRAERADAVAKWYSEEKGVDLTPAMAMAASDTLVTQMEQAQRYEMLRDAPRLSQWLVDDPVNAAVAQYEMQNLSGLEDLAASAGRGFAQTAAIYDRYVASSAAADLDSAVAYRSLLVDDFKSDLTPEDLARMDARIADLQVAADAALAEERDTLDRIDATYGRSASNVEMGKYIAAATELDGLGTQATAFIAIAQNRPLQLMGWLLSTAAESLPTMAATAAVTIVTKKPTIAATVAGLTSEARSEVMAFQTIANDGGYDLRNPEDRARLVRDPAVLSRIGDRAFTYGAVVGLIDGMSGGIAGKALSKSPVGNMLLQAITQGAMGASGEALGMLASGQELNMVDIIVEGIAELATAPIEVAAMGGGAARKAYRTRGLRQFFEAISQNASESDMRVKTPKRYRDAVASITKDGPAETIYVNADAAEELFQSGALTPEKLVELVPSLTVEGIQEAIDSGGLIEIPTADFASNIVGTDAADSLLDHYKIDPNGFSAAEARAFRDKLAESTADIERIITDAESGRTELEQVATDAYSQLVSDLQRVGRTARTAESEALQAVAFARTTAERLGMALPDFLARYPLMRVKDARDAGFVQRVSKAELPEVAKTGTGPDAEAVRAAAKDAGLADDATADEIDEALSDFGAADNIDDVTLNQSVPLREGTEDLSDFGIQTGSTVKVRQLGEALEARTRKKFGTIDRNDRSAAAMDSVSDAMVSELVFELENVAEGESAVGWYSDKLQAAIDGMGAIFPEFNNVAVFKGSNLRGLQILGNAKNARDLFTSLLAITSDGEKVMANIRLARDLYAHFRVNGEFPSGSKRKSRRGSSVEGNIEIINALLDEHGPAGMHKYLLEELRVSEVNAQIKEAAEALGKKPSGTSKMPASAVLPRSAALFGAKLGSFYANMMGADGYLTMDLWFSRTFNRYRGQFVPRVTGLKGDTLTTKGELKGMARFKKLIGQPDISDADAVAYVIIHHDTYAARKYKNPTPEESAANTIYKAMFVELVDEPFGVGDRGFMIAAVSQAQKKLSAMGHDLSVADIQAIMWYHEKRLYATLGARKSDDISFEEAAQRLVAEDLAATTDRPERPVTELYQRASGQRAVEAGEQTADASLEDFSGDVAPEAFAKDNWFIVTATQEADHEGPLDPRNIARNEELRQRLTNRGFDFIETEGRYAGEDRGVRFLVIGNEMLAKTFGRMYGQESVLTHKGLVYSDGRPNTPADHSGTIIGDAAKEQDFYSVLPNGTAFTMELNFGEEDGVVGRTLETRDDGKLVLTHWSDAAHATIDPAKAGTGPLRVSERKRNGPAKAYYGINPRAKASDSGTGYVREHGLGPVRHDVAVDPSKMYDWFTDPDELKSAIDPTLPKDQQMGAYEDAIKAAGYDGYFVLEDGSGRAVHGDAAVMFTAAEVEASVDESDVEAVTRAQIDAGVIVPDYTHYLEETEDSVLIPTADIEPIRARGDGIANGRGFMAAAARGEQAKRGPLQVQDLGGGKYKLWDGNSTYAIAKEAGMPVLPVRVLTREEYSREAAQKNADKILTPDGKPKRRIVDGAALGEAATRALLVELRNRQRFAGVDDIVKRQSVNDAALADATGTAAKKVGGEPLAGPPKTPDSIERIVAAKYNGNYNLLGDAIRTTVTASTVADADAVVKALGESYHVVDEGWATTPAGYFDRKVTIVMPDGMLGEVQIMPPQMLIAKTKKAKGGLGGHELYEVSRDATLTQAERDQALEDQRVLYSKVLAETDESFRQMLGITASPSPMTASTLSISERSTSGERSSDQTDAGSTDAQSDTPSGEGKKLKAADPSSDTTVGKALSDKKYFMDVSPFDPEVDPRAAGVKKNKSTDTLEQGARGKIVLPRPAGEGIAPVVTLFKERDMSTFLHESAHYFMYVTEDLILRGDATQGMVDDWTALKGWWAANAKGVAADGGVTEADVLTVLAGRLTGNEETDRAVNVGMQEQFARAYELYALEGKAPSHALRSAFEAFSAWVLSVYKHARKLNVEINDDVRQVFDRMLATDNEIAKVRDGNSMVDLIDSTAEELGISSREYEALVRLSTQAKDEARQSMLREIMAPLRAARKKEQIAARKVVQARIEREVNARPANRAREWMANQRWLGDENRPDLLPEGIRLDKAELIEMYGEDVVKKLPRGTRPIWVNDGTGVSADEAAGWFGFESGDALVKAIMTTPHPKKEIAARVEAEMNAKSGDIMAEGKVEEVAVDALHGDKKGQLLAAELRALGKRAPKNVKVTTRTQARAIARRTIRKMTVRKAVRSQMYLASERRASERVQQALAKKDFDAAFEAKRQQLLNYALYMESRAAAELVAKTERKVGRLGRKGTRKNLEGMYLPAIDAILEKYSFRKLTVRAERNSRALSDYIQMMTDAGRANELAIPSHVLSEATKRPYKTITVAELDGIYDSLSNIEHSARAEKKLSDAENQRELDAVVDGLLSEFNANVKNRKTNRVQTKKEKRRAGGRELLNLWLNTDSILRKMGGSRMGAAYDAIKKNIDFASNRAQDMRSEAATKFKEMYDVYSRREQNQMAVKREHKELGGSFSQWDLISIALNMGNQDNLNRLMDKDSGRGFNAAQIEYAKQQLTARDWDFVQSAWDMIDSYWELIAERERRTTGVVPKKVDATEVVTPFGTQRGGYYPIQYDGTMTPAVEAEQFNEMTANMRAGQYGKAQTRSGHLKERTGGSGGRVLQLGMEVMHMHIGKVIHDLAFSEAVNNASRVLSDPRVKEAFAAKALQGDHTALEMWLQDVATGQIAGGGFFGRMALRAKSGFTLAKLAFNMSTVLVQLTGVTQSLVVVGKKNYAIGMSQYIAGRPDKMAELVKARSSFMTERETTFQRDINDIMGEITTGPTGSVMNRWQMNVGKIGFWMMQKTQFYGVDMPTWLGAYNDAITNKDMTDADAVHFADRMVARAQASGVFADRSAFERGTLSRDTRQNGFVRLFTTLGSYMFAKGNIAYEEINKTKAGITGFNVDSFVAAFNGAVNMGLLFTVEAIGYNLIKGTLPDMGDDGEGDDWPTFLAKETALSMLGTLPVIRDAASGLQGFEAGAYGSILTTFTRPLEQIKQGEVDKALVKSLSNVAGVMFGLPSTQANRAIDAWWRAEEGDDVALIEVLMGARR